MMDVFPVEELKQKIKKKYDLLLCFSNYEERCKVIPRLFPREFFSKCLIFLNKDGCEESIQNKRALSESMAAAEFVELEMQSPILIADTIKEKLMCSLDPATESNIFIDITTFTHETLLILMAILKTEFSRALITCGYVNAKEYSTDCVKEEDKWLSRGIGNIRSVLGYSGVQKPSNESMLIVVVGYEYDRAFRIIEAIEPDYLALGYANSTDSTTEKNLGANKQFANLVKEMAAYYENVTEFNIPCNDPFEAYLALKKMVEEIDNKNIILVPMNNKISTIGAALLCFEKAEIQICYAPALVYNYSSYSSVGETCYLFDLNFASRILLQ